MQKKYLLVIITSLVLVGIMYYLYGVQIKRVTENNKKIMSYHTNIIKETNENINFRKVLFTGKESQLVVMSIPVGGEIGEETHKFTEQTLFFLSGTGEATLDGVVTPIVPGDVYTVVPGTDHNFINTGKEVMKVYTVYAPPNHIDGTIHFTKADADKDVDDEAVGESAPKR